MSANVGDLRARQKSQRLLGSLQAAVRSAQEVSRHRGVPNVYSYDGKLHYELPNGELTTEVPEIYRAKSEPSKS